MTQRIGKASSNFARLSSCVWSSHHLITKLNVRVHSAFILSGLLHSSETLCTYRRQERRLNAFRFRCFRSFFGVLWRNHVPDSQGRTEVRWRPAQETSLAPLFSNLMSFGSKCTVLKKALVALSGLLGARGIVPPSAHASC